MGNRSRLGRVEKWRKWACRNMNYQDVKEILENHTEPYRPSFHEQLFELGKDHDFTKGSIPFYAFDIYKESECEFYIMTKEELKALIDDYRKMVVKGYQSLYQGDLDFAKSFALTRLNEWNNDNGILPYYLDEEVTDGEIVNSWKFEYSIFNLVYIYRTFDWKKDFLIYSAW